MRTRRTSAGLACLGPLFCAVIAAAPLDAQVRAVLPEGSVIIVRTTSPLESGTARVGQTFETVVADTVGVEDYTVIPAGSRIRGVVTFVQPADRQRSGVMEVSFDQLTLPDGRTHALSGKLTSIDAAERRQIEQQPDTRVVLVGGRGGIGAAIAGAGSERSPASGILGALGTLLSQAQNVRVPTGTRLAVQLEQDLVLSRRGAARSPGGFTLYTGAERIRAAQQALARLNYYRGATSGRLDDATQRALFEFQVDRGLLATGNLDRRTADALDISGAAGAGDAAGAAVLSPEEASLLRRAAQTLVGRYRQELAVSTTGGLSARRSYGEEEIELWFALSGFADNASLYEQLVRGAGNADASEAAGQALLGAARRVDAALQRARASQPVQSAWSSLRAQLAELESADR